MRPKGARVTGFLIVLALALTGSGCVSSGPGAGRREGGGDPELSRVRETVNAQKREMRISPQDLVSISVYREPDLAKDIRVSADGRISFPLVGEVVVGGLTPLEAEAKLKELLKTQFVDPQVSVQVKEYRERKVFVLGEVVKPGSYEIPPDRPLTVVEAIALSGGLTKYASANRTRVVREVDGDLRSVVVPVKKVTAGDKSKDMELTPGDVVYVPETLF